MSRCPACGMKECCGGGMAIEFNTVRDQRDMAFDTLERLKEDIERLQDLIHNFTAFVERQAFKIPAPNPHTPALLEGIVTARNAAIEIKSGEPK